MKYISLFSGIGGFEVAIHSTFPNANCLGYSEIKPSAKKIYENHFPGHMDLGDISKISIDTVEDLVKDGCDLVVGGFPCTNLSSMATLKGNHSGLNGPKSGLFYQLLNFLRIVFQKCPETNIIIENNASMSSQNRDLITSSLQTLTNRPIYLSIIDNAELSVQTRKRLFWTTFPVEKPTKCIHEWKDILEPLESIDTRFYVSDAYMNGMNTIIKQKKSPYLVFMRKSGEYQEFFVTDNPEKNGRTRYQLSMHSDTGDKPPYAYPIGKSRPICAGGGGGFSHGMLIDRRAGGDGQFLFRYFTMKEKERLFGFPDDYTKFLSNTSRSDVLGNAVSVYCVRHILKYFSDK